MPELTLQLLGLLPGQWALSVTDSLEFDFELEE
jgi:hypothetical protein